ncbi:ATP-binding protein [Streptomyces zagrosensis]|uniref:Anti-sigma regulatory factor (Ser/Thr protein kinase) n=1 Tax=Streptomyces zagrosensis TaxID=1042984 RepID=A0A7W9QCY2_9ACTN|nr:ATP-binding protein [Streptomyces zagrosensis]MBB5936712.1 anti-sigma regulatory factor (Ser/Thr protein kinase) [Streptomyces zagrosensis]
MPEEPRSYGLFIPRDPRAIGIVRATVRSVLGATGLNCLAETVELLASELATNAYRNAHSDAYVSMDWQPGDFRVTVWDTGPGLPVRRSAEDTDEHGRGMGIIAARADDWGVQRHPGGKAVWFSLKPPPIA